MSCSYVSLKDCPGNDEGEGAGAYPIIAQPLANSDRKIWKVRTFSQLIFYLGDVFALYPFPYPIKRKTRQLRLCRTYQSYLMIFIKILTRPQQSLQRFKGFSSVLLFLNRAEPETQQETNFEGGDEIMKIQCFTTYFFNLEQGGSY